MRVFQWWFPTHTTPHLQNWRHCPKTGCLLLRKLLNSHRLFPTWNHEKTDSQQKKTVGIMSCSLYPTIQCFSSSLYLVSSRPVMMSWVITSNSKKLSILFFYFIKAGCTASLTEKSSPGYLSKAQYNIWAISLFLIFMFIFEKMKRKLNKFYPRCRYTWKGLRELTFRALHFSGQEAETEGGEVTRSSRGEVTVIDERLKPQFSRLLTQGPSPPMRLASWPPWHLVHLSTRRDTNKEIPR